MQPDPNFQVSQRTHLACIQAASCCALPYSDTLCHAAVLPLQPLHQRVLMHRLWTGAACTADALPTPTSLLESAGSAAQIAYQR